MKETSTSCKKQKYMDGSGLLRLRTEEDKMASLSKNKKDWLHGAT